MRAARRSIAIEKRYTRYSIMSNDDDIYDTKTVWNLAAPPIAMNTALLAVALIGMTLCWWNPVAFAVMGRTALTATLSLGLLLSLPTAAQFICGGRGGPGRTDTLVPYSDYYNGYTLQQTLPGGMKSGERQVLIPRLSHIDGLLYLDEIEASVTRYGSKRDTAKMLKAKLVESYQVMKKAVKK